MRLRGGLLAIIWIIVGVAVAASHHYFQHLGTIRGIVSAALAIILWPLVLLGINLHIRR